jgi:site-specific recombinase XerD
LALPDPTWDEDINLTLRRVRRAKANRPKQAKGMTRGHLDKCLATQPDSPWGLRNRAMISLGYDLLTRRSELVALQTNDIEFREDDTLRVLIRRSKADALFAVSFVAIFTAMILPLKTYRSSDPLLVLLQKSRLARSVLQPILH